MQKLQFYVPENFDADAIMDRLGIKNNRNRTRDVFHYIVGSIVKIAAAYAGKDDGDSYLDFAPRLNATSLKKVIGSRYKQYLDQLEAAQVLYRSTSYLPNERCKAHILAEVYRDSRLRCVEISDESLLTQYADVVMLRRRERATQLGNFTPLLDWMYHDDLHVDVCGAKEWIGAYQSLLSSKIQASASRRSVKSTLLRNVDEAADSFTVKLNSISKRDFTDPDFDPFGFWFHSPLTNLKSELRRFVTFRGEQLTSVDIKNSQPYFLVPVLQGLRFSTLSSDERRQLDEWLQFGPKKLESGKEVSRWRGDESEVNSESIMLHNYLDAGFTDQQFFAEPPVDQLSFSDLVKEGTLYEELLKMLSGKFIINGFDRFGDRDRVKTGALWLMYHDPVTRSRFAHKGGFYEPVKLFQERFPVEFAVMERIKKNQYRMLSRLLQRLESFVMYQLFFLRMCREHPEVPLFPIHDCWMTTESHSALVERVVKEECEKIVGCPPKTDTKRLQRSGAIRSLVQLRNKKPDDVVREMREKRIRRTRKKALMGR